MRARAMTCMVSQGDVVLRKMSSLYRTRPWGRFDQEDFVNAAAEVATHLSPMDLLTKLKLIEQGLGRRPGLRWGPREIDLDILFYGDQVLKAAELTIPHPYVCERAFVIVPLAEIAPCLVHPETGITISAYCEQLEKGGARSWMNRAI